MNEAELLEIVKAFADREPLYDTDMGWNHCVYCNGEDLPVGGFDHDDDCPWVVANKEVAARASS